MEKGLLIKYGELALKGKNRYLFENKLLKHIKASLSGIGHYNVFKEQGRIIAVLDDDCDVNEAVSRIQKIFGIIGISPVYILDDNGFENIVELSKDFLNNYYEDLNTTFKVVAKRADKKYPMDSMEICRELGARLLEADLGLSVDVKKPEIALNVEVRTKTYIYSSVYKGLGGMPVGTNGKAMLLLSGGIDSPVAGYLMNKRGVYVEAVYFHAPPYISERAKQKVVSLAKILSRYNGPFKLHVVPFTDVQLAIYDRAPHEQLTIIMRRYMMKIAEHIANERKAKALVTGESIGQVASQTIESLAATNDATDLPVFRPLVSFDKIDIVRISEKIDSYETSILPYEDCCTIFVAKHPVTKPRLDAVKRYESRLGDDFDSLVQKAIEDTEVIEISE